MFDYIKREDALDIVAHNNVHGEITLNRYDKIIDGIYEIPPADVAPIRYGKWVEDYNEQEPAGFKLRWRCTACDNWQTYGQTFFCPYCGARMIDGGGTDADRID